MGISIPADWQEKGTRLTSRQRFAAALDRRPLPGRVPHFELVFFLTMEVFGKVHPSHRAYHQWLQMSEHERQVHRRDMAQVYVDTARKFEHDAIFLHPNPSDLEETMRLIDEVRRISGDEYFLLLHGDCTHGIPDGKGMEEISIRMLEDPQGVENEAESWLKWAIERGEKLAKHGGIDGFALCSDYCFNSGPFLPLDWFDRFVLPFLGQVTQAYRQMGLYTIKHTDGNIMPILDRLVSTKPHALHSLDPQGGVDMAVVVDRVGDQVAFCGNVDCGKLQTGTDAQCVESARYAIRHGLRAPGYIFSTSNCVYTGMDLARYELIRRVWMEEGVRK